MFENPVQLASLSGPHVKNPSASLGPGFDLSAIELTQTPGLGGYRKVSQAARLILIFCQGNPQGERIDHHPLGTRVHGPRLPSAGRHSPPDGMRRLAEN